MANESTLGLIFSISADASKADAAVARFKTGILQLKNGMTAYGEVSRKALDSEPVMVYDSAVKRVAGSTAQWEKESNAALAALKEQVAAAGGATRATNSFTLQQRESAAAATTQADRIRALQIQYQELAADAARLSKMPFLSPEAAAGLQMDKELMQQVQGEAVQLGATIQEAGTRGAQGIFQSITSLRQFRILMYSTLGLISFGFYISEWENLVHWISEASTELGGFSKKQQDVFAQQVKFNDELISKHPEVEVKRLTAQQDKLNKQIKDTEAKLKAAEKAGSTFGSANAEMGISVRAFSLDEKPLLDKLADLKKQYADNDAALQKYTLMLAKNQENQQKHDKATKHAAGSEKELARAIAAADRAVKSATVHVPLLIQQLMALEAQDKRAAAAAQARATVYRQSEAYGRTLPGGLLKGVSGSVGAMPSPTFGSWAVVTPEMRAATAQLQAATKAQQAALHAQQQAYRRTAEIARESFSIMGEAVGQYGGTFGRIYSQVSRVTELMINLHRLESMSAVKAAAAKAAGQTAAIGKVSLVKSAFETAEGIAALARLDFHAAALHFASSAKFLTVLGIAASVAGGLGALGSGNSAVASAAARSGSSSSLTGSGAARGGEPGKGPAGFATGRGQQGARTYINLNYGILAPTVAQQQQLVTGLNAGGNMGVVRLTAGELNGIPAPAY